MRETYYYLEQGGSLMDDIEFNNDEIVYVPVPRRLLPALYQTLAAALAEPPDDDETASSNAVSGETKRNLIDLIVKVAYEIEANLHPVSLSELYAAYQHAYPGIGKGSSRGSFDATVNYHCINMRSRFPYINDKRKTAYWLTRPAFKRIGRGRYILLSQEEIAWFRRAIEEDNPLIYTDEYDVADLARNDDQ